MLNKAIYGLIQAGRCWNNTFCVNMTLIRFQQSKADPWFLKVNDGEAFYGGRPPLPLLSFFQPTYYHVPQQRKIDSRA